MLLQFICLKHPIVILCILTHGDILRIVFTVLASFHSRFKGSLWAGLPVLSCDALQPQQFSCKPDLLLLFASRQSFIQLYSTPLFPPSDTSHHIPPQLHYFLASLFLGRTSSREKDIALCVTSASTGLCSSQQVFLFTRIQNIYGHNNYNGFSYGTVAS